jgi:hypothetical protein
MTASWKDVRCASIPVDELRWLAGLRGRPAIRIAIAGDRAWVVWEPDSEALHDVLARRILPRPGVKLYSERGG